MTIHLTSGTQRQFRYRTHDLNIMDKVDNLKLAVQDSAWSLNGGEAEYFYIVHVPVGGMDWTFEYKGSTVVSRLNDPGDFNTEYSFGIW